VAEFNIEPHYWAANSPTCEVDFILEQNGSIILLEVKAEKTPGKESEILLQEIPPQNSRPSLHGEIFPTDYHRYRGQFRRVFPDRLAVIRSQSTATGTLVVSNVAPADLSDSDHSKEHSARQVVKSPEP